MGFEFTAGASVEDSQRRTKARRFKRMDNLVAKRERLFDLIDTAVEPQIVKEIDNAVTFLSSTDVSKEFDVFSNEDATSSLLQTAVLNCNFADISRISQDIFTRLRETGKWSIVTQSVKTTVGACAQEVMDKQAHGTKVLVAFENADTMDVTRFERLISIINGSSSNVALLLCYASGMHCLKDTLTVHVLNQLNVRTFSLASGLHTWRTIGTALSHNDDGILLSGTFLKSLRSDFLLRHFSIDSVKQHIWKAICKKEFEETARHIAAEKPFYDRISLYRGVFDVLCSQLEIRQQYDFHERLQFTENFWSSGIVDQIEEFRTFKQRFTGPVDAITEIVERFIDIVTVHCEEYCEPLRETLQSLKKADAETVPSVTGMLDVAAPGACSTPTSVSKPVKMSFTQLREANASKRKDKSPLLGAKTRVLTELMNLLRRLLVTWDALPSSTTYLLNNSSGNEFISMREYEFGLTQASGSPLSTSVELVLEDAFSKSVSIAKCGSDYLARSKMAPSSLYCALAQLEIAGIIRATTGSKGQTNLNILYHPCNYVA